MSLGDGRAILIAMQSRKELKQRLKEQQKRLGILSEPRPLTPAAKRMLDLISKDAGLSQKRV